MRLTERKATLPEIAKILKVQYVLEGSLLRSGHEGHVTAQLIRVSDDSHVWSEEFDFPWKDLLTVRQKISESVIRQMNIQLQPEEEQLLARGSTKNVKAYQAHARGRYSLVRFSYSREPSYLIEAENYFKRALEEDPQYANSLADLAYVCYQRIYPPQGDRKELAAKGISYAERALAIAPNHCGCSLYFGLALRPHGRSRQGPGTFAKRLFSLAPTIRKLTTTWPGDISNEVSGNRALKKIASRSPRILFSWTPTSIKSFSDPLGKVRGSLGSGK